MGSVIFSYKKIVSELIYLVCFRYSIYFYLKNCVMKKSLILVLLVFYIYPLFAQQELRYNTVYDIPYYESSTDSYINERCKIDIYYSENTSDFPTVVWFHGGGLSGGEKFIPQELKDNGLAVVAVNYRLLPHVNL